METPNPAEPPRPRTTIKGHPYDKPFGGLTPTQAGKLGGAASARVKREKLNPQARGEVPAGELLAVQWRLLELARGEHGASPTVQVQAARALQEWAKLGTAASSSSSSSDVPATREERAAERAALLLRMAS